VNVIIFYSHTEIPCSNMKVNMTDDPSWVFESTVAQNYIQKHSLSYVLPWEGNCQ